MSRLVVTILLTLFLFSTLIAQNDTTFKKNSLIEGAWAMQFQIYGLVYLYPFQGTTISVKKHLTDRSAVRAGVGITFDISDESYNKDQLYYYNYFKYTSYEQHSYSLTVRGQYLFYLFGSTDVNLFVGSGPEISYSWGKNEYDGDTASYVSRNISTGLGISGVIGVEWFATSSISFHAEYSTIAKYTRTDYKRELKYVNTALKSEINSSNGDYFKFNPNSVMFGVSLYF